MNINIKEDISQVKNKSTSFINEFKTFAIRGNVVDLAVGVIIGAAFNNIIQSLVKDIILPPIGLITGKVDFASLYINLSNIHYKNLTEAQQANAPVIAYGLFINNVIQFVLTAFVIFIIVKQINKLNANKDNAKSPETKPCPYCLSVININATKCPECTADIPKEDLT